MLRHLSLIPLLLILLLMAAPGLSAAETVKPGDLLLYEEGFQPLKGKRFALVTNHSAIVEGVHVLELMGRKGVMPAVIFTPEHGLEGRAEDGARLDNGTYHGVPVKSLYGASKKPNPEDLKGLDLVVFDIQDVGVRFYTYISTMGYVMQAAAEAGVPFMVLDRPNPLGGNYVAGFVRDKLPATFTSLYPIPEVHGLTVGELALLIKGEGLLPGLANLDLSVVRIQGWERSMRWPDTGLPWIATSPNLASFDSALLYPGTGLLEGTSASEGRGSTEPFRLAGWPEIDGQALATKLNGEGLPGLHFEPVRFKPVSMPGVSSAPKYKNREISGVRLVITDYHSVLPVESGIALLAGLYGAVKEPARKVFFHGGIDDMSGSTEVRSGIEAGLAAPAIVAKWAEGDQKFLELRRKYLLYQ